MIQNLFKRLRVSIVFGALFLFLNCSSQTPQIWLLRDIQSLDAKVINTVQWLKTEKSNYKFLNKRNINTPSKAITDILKIILLSSAEKHNISPLLIANKEDLKLIALGEKDVKALKGWRYDIFGSFALKLMEGKFSLKIKNGSVIID